MIFKDKLCWVTGASSGIGEALAMELAKNEARLIISSNDANELLRVQQNCLKHTSQCEALPFDLSNPIEVETTAKQAIEKFGPV
ncbi:MAG TPA: SDR family NAD(P)-dependent oxidoreductase, partial [Tenuifilaceae bacterium]|nr:SDR family NAD(P)-dependent oxidoreductase [Tenuifilaceae bacterium]